MSRPEYSIRLLRIAEEDLRDIVSYIAADHPSAVDRLADRIEKDLQLLARNPQLGRIPDEEELLRSGYRYLVVENYLIFYTLGEKTILVHRIFHGARDYKNLR